MKNNKYVAPVVELLKLSAKEDCMLQNSGESDKATFTVAFGDLLDFGQ